MSSPGRQLWTRLGLVALLGYGVFLARNFAVVAGGSDSSGYLNSARLLAGGRLTEPVRRVPELADQPWDAFVPLGFRGAAGSDTCVPTYPVGLPLHLASAAMLAGWHWGPLLASVTTAVMAVFLCHACAREIGIAPPLAAAAAIGLAVSPVFIFAATQTLSDVSATMWCAAAFLAALRARDRPAWALACGVAVGIAVLVRPSDVLVIPALALVLWRPRSLLLAAAAGLPFAIAMALYQEHLYGSPFRSGYPGIWSEFAMVHFGTTLAHFAVWIARLLPAGVLVLPLLVARPWTGRARVFAALCAWVAAFVGFYAFYAVSHEAWWCLRFLLPAFPAVVLLAVLGLEAAAKRSFADQQARAGLVAAVALVGINAAMAWHWMRQLTVLDNNAYQYEYVDSCAWAHANLPGDAIVVTWHASGAIYYYTPFPVLRWDQIGTDDLPGVLAALEAAGRPVFALLSPADLDEAMARMGARDRWERVHEIGSFSVWRLEPPRADERR